MRKLKYQGGITKFITSKIAKKNKNNFGKYVDENLRSIRGRLSMAPVPFALVSFSSGNDFYDQVLSILSFLRFVGKPVLWTVYSDGTHTEKQIKTMTEGFEFVRLEIISWETADSLPNCKNELQPYEDELFDYAKKKPLGRKLFYFLNHKVICPTLFLDADIVFYEQASILNLIIKEKVNGWYLPDFNWGCLDSRYKENHEQQFYQLNGGFLLLSHELPDFSDGLNFLRSLNFTYEYFTDQTILHILSRSNGLMPLDPRIFILDSGDQFDFSYLHPKDKIAIRHYTGPVRHKMWQRDWKWQLSLD